MEANENIMKITSSSEVNIVSGIKTEYMYLVQSIQTYKQVLKNIIS